MTHTSDVELRANMIRILKNATAKNARETLAYLPEIEQSVQAYTAAKVRESQTTGVAFAISVIDELHIGIASSDTTDRLLRGIKNQIRDRYKAETGVDPAPSYPVEAGL